MGWSRVKSGNVFGVLVISRWWIHIHDLVLRDEIALYETLADIHVFEKPSLVDFSVAIANTAA